MRAFAHLLDRLSLTSSRNAKLTLIKDFLRETPDPERGWVLAALTGALSFNAAKPAFIRKAVESRMDAQLFAWSYDYVGDLAETVALVWPERPGANREPDLSEVVESLRTASRTEVQRPSASRASSQPSISRCTSARGAVRRLSTTSDRSGSRLAPGLSGQTRATVSARSPT